MKIAKILALAIPTAAILFLLSCKSPAGPGNEETAFAVYAGGYRYDGIRDVAVYWLDDGDSISYVELQPGDIGEVTDIHADNDGVVYAVGWYNSGSTDNAAYWNDGVLTTLDTNGRATGMYVTDAGVTYISGYYDDGSGNIAAYWVVDGATVSRQDLHTTSLASATDIVVDGGVVYTSGYYLDGTDVAVYWIKAGGAPSAEILYDSGLAQATGIVLDGSGIVNVAGVYQDVSIRAALWRTDAAGLVTLNSSTAFGRAVGIVDGTVNAVGDFTDSGNRQAVVWDGISELLLPMSGGATDSYAYGAQGYNGVLYVAGSIFTGGEEFAVYWKGIQLVPLTGTVQSRANAVYVR